MGRKQKSPAPYSEALVPAGSASAVAALAAFVAGFGGALGVLRKIAAATPTAAAVRAAMTAFAALAAGLDALAGTSKSRSRLQGELCRKVRTVMGREVELKLLVPPAAIAEVESMSWIRERASGPVTHEELTNVYFDTRKFMLRAHGVALRVRHIGKKRLQTIKSVTKPGPGAFARDEWEFEITGDKPDLQLAKDTALAPLVTRKLGQKLRPVFTTSVWRDTFPMQSDGAALELAVDHGSIEAGDRCDPIDEIEIELKEGGDAGALSEIAQRLARSVPAAYGARSKPERGYALAAGQAGAAVRARPIGLDPEMEGAAAFKMIGLSCLDHALSNERAIAEGDAEGIHQMRVGLRRLRAAISLFKDMVRGPETDAVKDELEWLTGQFASARDLDVLIEDHVRPLQEDGPMRDQLRVLAQHLAVKRDLGFATAKEKIDSERYRSIGVKTALWLADGEWTRNRGERFVERRERPVAAFAGAILGRRFNKIIKKADKIDKLDDRGRHKLRIAVKKLRYACGFFAGLFDDRKQARQRRRFDGALKKIQSSLGALNDIAIDRRMTSGIAHRGERTKQQMDEALAIGFIAGEEQQLVEHCLADVAKRARRLAKLPVFWL